MTDRLTSRLRQARFPAATFILVMAVHFLWLGLFPEQDPAQVRWLAVGPSADPSWWSRYMETGSYWLGYSYALSIAFAAAFRRYRTKQFCVARNFAIGGVTFSGVLAAAGCFLIGCCGSPMLAVYLNLFGAGFIPLAKPMAAALTTVSILGAWRWMIRRTQSTAISSPPTASCEQPSCRCE